MLSMCASSSAPIVAQIETTRKPTEPIIVVISISPLSRQNVKIPQKIAQIVEITDLKIDFFIFFFSFPLLCLYYSMELVVCQVFFPFLFVKFLTSGRPGRFVNCLTSKNAKIVWKIIPDYLLFPKFRDGRRAKPQAL